MNYYNLSSSVIACENFIPDHIVNDIYTDFLNGRKSFNIPNWGNRGKQNKNTADCEALDYWISYIDNTEYNLNIKKLIDWFLHQGFSFYAEKNGCNMYNFLTLTGRRERDLAWDIHVISYNNKGYYNWHTDSAKNNLFTFNLILNKSDKLLGGDMMFMEDGKIIKIKNKNNFMIVFPSYVPHAITPLHTVDDKDVAFLEQRFSVQFWIKWKQAEDE